ncbi:hypothetical protein B0H19DRAFT_1237406 [Mycena capillaripes]|nr:hypothetical protein B0H19DRAFT_1237406 [Mycena capillaripes]
MSSEEKREGDTLCGHEREGTDRNDSPAPRPAHTRPWSHGVASDLSAPRLPHRQGVVPGIYTASPSWNLEREKTGEKQGRDADAKEERKSASSARRARMHERDAGKTHPSSYKIRTGCRRPSERGTGQGPGGDGESAAHPAPAAARGILRARARNACSIPESVRTAFPRLTNGDGAACVRGREDGDGDVLVSVLAPELVFVDPEHGRRAAACAISREGGGVRADSAWSSEFRDGLPLLSCGVAKMRVHHASGRLLSQ